MNVLKVDNNRWNFSDFILLFYLVCLFAFSSGEGIDHWLNLLAFAMCICVIIVQVLTGNFYLTIPRYTVYLCVFLGYAVASYLWAEWPEFVFSSEYSNILVEGIQLIVISIFNGMRIKSRKDVDKTINIIWCAINIMIIKIIVCTPVAYYVSGKRIGTVTGLWVTDVGAIEAIGIGITCYYLSKETNRTKKIILIAILIVEVVYMFLTGSRQAILMTLIFVIAYFLLTSYGIKRASMLFRLTIGIIIVYIMIMKIPVLYNAIGERIMNILGFIGYGSETDSSAETRTVLMQFAREMFLERPIFGWGYANVAAYTEHNGYFITTFAHNTYYELLADLGIVGFLLFYCFQFHNLIKLYKNVRKKNKMGVLLFSLLLTLLFADYISVTILVIYHHIIIQTLCIYSDFEADDNRLCKNRTKLSLR